MNDKADNAAPGLGEMHAAIERLADASDRVPGRIRDEYLEEVARLRDLLVQAEQAQAHAPTDSVNDDQESLRLGVQQAIDKALARFGSPD